MDFRSRLDLPAGPGRSTVALVTAFSLVATPAMGLLAATRPAPAGQATLKRPRLTQMSTLAGRGTTTRPLAARSSFYQPQVES